MAKSRSRQHHKGKARPSDHHGGHVEAEEWEAAMALWPDTPVAAVDYTDAAPAHVHRQGMRKQRRTSGGAK